MLPKIVDDSGQEVVLANLSARQAKERGWLMSGTFGPRSSTLSRSASLASFLESKLAEKLRSLGSTLYKMTSKVVVTPAGRRIFRLQASVPRTSDNACIGAGYVTTTTRDWKDVGEIRPRKDGRMRADQLPRQAALVGYATPTATDGSRGIGTIRPQDTGIPLPQMVSGVMSNGSLTKTENGDRLNPELSLWLMGLPDAYLSCLLSAIPLWLQRRKSSKRP